MTEGEIERKTELQWHTPEKALDIITNQVVSGANDLHSIKLRDKIVMFEAIKCLHK